MNPTQLWSGLGGCCYFVGAQMLCLFLCCYTMHQRQFGLKQARILARQSNVSPESEYCQSLIHNIIEWLQHASRQCYRRKCAYGDVTHVWLQFMNDLSQSSTLYQKLLVMLTSSILTYISPLSAGSLGTTLEISVSLTSSMWPIRWMVACLLSDYLYLTRYSCKFSTACKSSWDRILEWRGYC